MTKIPLDNTERSSGILPYQLFTSAELCLLTVAINGLELNAHRAVVKIVPST